MSIEITIHGTGVGQCSLSGKEGEGLIVSFKDGTLREGFLSHRAFLQLVKMKFAQAGKPSTAPVQTVPMVGNGPAKS
ncbi:MAG: hypothetical protein L0241_28250 [Planctomycetia bacterium]|nr:hypothetical protein [Planctomycetia bacterium]